jgi:hypothetical protein
MSFLQRISGTVMGIFLLAFSCDPGSAGSFLKGEARSVYPTDAVLQDLLSRSELVFLGRCVNLTEETVPGAVASIVTVTFNVGQNLIGPDADEISFRYYQSSGISESGPEPSVESGRAETAAYGAFDSTIAPSPDENSGRTERLDSNDRRPRRSVLGRQQAPLRFRVGEEVVLFLPPLTGNGFLRTNDPGFAKMSVVDLGPEGVRAAIASAGPSALTAPPFLPGIHGDIEELIGRIEDSAARRPQQSVLEGKRAP